MDPATIKSVAGVLAAWNPLGPKVADVPDLDGYSTEAIDIISVIGMGPVTLKAVESAVQRVMNEAFNLSLAPQHCRDAAEKIHVVLASQEQ
jgi:hypothetical protein